MSAPTFDAATLARLHDDLGSEEDVTRDIVRTFVQSADDLVRDAREALESGDATVVRRVMHTLRSSAGTIGALRLAELAAAAEERLMGGGKPEAGEVEAVAAELDRARGPIAAWRP